MERRGIDAKIVNVVNISQLFGEKRKNPLKASWNVMIFTILLANGTNYEYNSVLETELFK